MSNDELISKAYEAMKNSYAPYSKFNVGAVALCGEKIYIGCNIENASFGATICAERCAIFKAVSDGCTKIDKIVIVCSTHDFAYPCGICRQVMTEFMDENGIIVVTNDKEIREYKLSDLMPESFRM
ncbi:MAG: cytidine deaminase [Eubacterium sp.]|jgi:cytidine deaminase|uniref:Cytidine deaminase n=1 Tax=Eubacterium album TaxID=2978477 RepID=A0ABT2M3V2_9FIRM|nr:cytidine deaminase [Eubacterium sp. LFL-14]MCJ7966003.1 cytidine deaminase [Lachnospiraceae bacterium NSJ-171]MCT7399332.1 cytidine deaminase [Eubacterium sp. LFL-14]CDA29049.1 cytidine deaminase [Eubacterium sp. CAG:156]